MLIPAQSRWRRAGVVFSSEISALDAAAFAGLSMSLGN
jgi:hypothetical protein